MMAKHRGPDGMGDKAWIRRRLSMYGPYVFWFPSCSHSRTETVDEYEDFVLRPGGMPLATDIVNSRTTCLDCGKEVFRL